MTLLNPEFCGDVFFVSLGLSKILQFIYHSREVEAID